MAARQFTQEGSWNSLHRSEASGEVSNDDLAYPENASTADEDESDEESMQSLLASPSLPTVRDVQRVLHPLQATADRIGKQVEQFAENLDRLSSKRLNKQSQESKDCQHVLPFIHAYKKTASDTVKHLRTLHSSDRQRSNASHQAKIKSRSRSARSTSSRRSTPDRRADNQKLTTVADLKRWEQEEQTWDLVASMIQVEFPLPEGEHSNMIDVSCTRPGKSKELHSYSTEKEIWNSFLATDDLAWERHTVLNWLRRTADQSGQDIEQVIEQYESDADRGSGIVAHSWLYTREAIKGQKRLKSLPRAFEPNNNGLDRSLLNAAKTEALVTQLDPDAMTRQDRALEKQDLSFERAIWLACWEMLRRGKPWTYIKDWCSERAELWRSAVMHADLQMSQDSDWQSQHLWRKACAVAAKNGGINEYERAVYGVLSGYLPSVQQVGRNWSDQLFAHYNAYLINSFERYIKSNFANRMTAHVVSKAGPLDLVAFAGQRAFSGNQLVEKLKLSDATKQEATTPFKMLQGSLIARNFGDFVFKHGARLCQAANETGHSKVLSPLSSEYVESSTIAPISMQDYDFLRIVTHIIFIYQEMGHAFEDRDNGDKLYATESFIVAYTDYLSKAGKQQLLPLYASRLSHERSLTCLGRQLPLVREDQERENMMKLMKTMGIDVPGVLQTQLRLIIQDSPPDHIYLTDYPSLKILEPVESSATRIPPIARAFIGHQVSEDHLDLIHGFEWFKFLEGHWPQTMALGVMVYKYILRCQGLAAGRFMCQRIPFSDLSFSKTTAILGTAVNLSQSPLSDEEGDRPTSPMNPGKRNKARPKRSHQRHRSDAGKDADKLEMDILLMQATSFRDLENLFIALSVMDDWVRLAEEVQYRSQHATGTTFRVMLKPFKEAFQAVEAAMQPLLRGWLQNPRNDNEAREFKQIRLACLPELIVAYNSILNYSSYFAGREILKTSMDLAALIAEEDSDVALCLIEAGRMPELVDSFAVVAKSMIIAEARKPGEKHRDGKTLGLWSAKVRATANES